MMQLRPPSYKVTVEHDVAVAMRDGTVLRSIIYRPDAPGQFPVLITRTPYGSDDQPSDDRAIELAERGYVAVRQDIRGRYTSDGDFTNSLLGVAHTDVEDGYDSAQWCAQLPYSDGSVGTFGISYDGWTSWPMAASRPPALRAMTSGGMAGDSRERDLSGVWRIATQLFGQSGIATDARRRLNDHSGPQTMEHFEQVLQHSFHKWLWYLPLAELPDAVHGPTAEEVRNYLRRMPTRNEYDGPYHDEVEIPCLHLTGWYDIHLMCYKRFSEMRRLGRSPLARENQKLIIGPWRHNVMIMDPKEGDMDFGPEADGSYSEIMCQWYDHWLKGVDNGVMREPAVKLFVMGTNSWKTADDFPVPGTKYKTYYTHSGGRLGAEPPGDEPGDCYEYDPRDPVPSLLNFVNQPTPRDQRQLDYRRDILRYETDPLAEDLEIIGEPRATLHVASSALDTDFFVKLIDVHPDGRAINLCMGVMRARYRDGLDAPKLLTPGEPVKLEIQMLPTANRFFAGHRIRVAITSSDFPDFDRNHNTGGKDYEESQLRAARNTIFHDRQRATRVDLPIAPI